MKHNNDFKFDLDFGLISEKYYGKVVSDIANGLTECKAERDQWVETGNTFVEFKSRVSLAVLPLLMQTIG